MAHLTDMEELLAMIQDPPIRDYMREAMNCYMASAYRGCIVLSYIALFDDLLSKLGELSKVNSSAKIIFNEVKQKKENQDVYESFLIDKLGSNKLLSGLDTSFLSTLRTLRNKSAHPSGHHPSAAEARFIFHETITRFLSRPILSTTQLVEEIVSRLSNSNFFPSNQISEIADVVAEEIASLHEKAIPLLINKLGASVISTDTTLAMNSSYFLVGLAYLDKDSINRDLQNKVLRAKSDDVQYSASVLKLLSANGKLILDLPAVCIGRIRRIISKQIDEVTAATSESQLIHPTRVIRSIAKHVDSAMLLATFKPELEKLFEKRPYSPYLLGALSGHPEVFSLYYTFVIRNAGSGDFHTANSFARSIKSIDSELAALCTDEQAFKLLIAVLQAAGWNAFDAKSLEDTKFAGIPALRAKAIAYIRANDLATKAYLDAKLALTETSESFILNYLTESSAI